MSLTQQVLRFASVGAAGTALHYLVLVASVALLHASPALGAMLGAGVGALSNYCLNRRFSFASGRRHREAFPRFVVMVILGILLNGGLMQGLTRLGLHYLAAQVVATVLLLGVNFFLSRQWIFTRTL